MKSENGKNLDVGCNNILTIPLITANKIVRFLEVLEGLNAVLTKAYIAPRPAAAF